MDDTGAGVRARQDRLRQRYRKVAGEATITDCACTVYDVSRDAFHGHPVPGGARLRRPADAELGRSRFHFAGRERRRRRRGRHRLSVQAGVAGSVPGDCLSCSSDCCSSQSRA